GDSRHAVRSALLMQPLEARGADGLAQQQLAQAGALVGVEELALAQQLLDDEPLLLVLQPGDRGPLGLDRGAIGRRREDRLEEPVASRLDLLRALAESLEKIRLGLAPAPLLRLVETEVTHQPRKVVRCRSGAVLQHPPADGAENAQVHQQRHRENDSQQRVAVHRECSAEAMRHDPAPAHRPPGATGAKTSSAPPSGRGSVAGTVSANPSAMPSETQAAAPIPAGTNQ